MNSIRPIGGRWRKCGIHAWAGHDIHAISGIDKLRAVKGQKRKQYIGSWRLTRLIEILKSPLSLFEKEGQGRFLHVAKCPTPSPHAFVAIAPAS